MAEKIQSIPEARLLLASLRSVGYNEETAIADIIDNCISAQAHEIKIQFDWEKKRIVILDDGIGMSEKFQKNIFEASRRRFGTLWNGDEDCCVLSWKKADGHYKIWCEGKQCLVGFGSNSNDWLELNYSR